MNETNQIELKQKTHLKINKSLSGEIIELNSDRCRVKLIPDEKMVVDEHGLVHGGFIFSLANYAAMLAVNKPNVVLASANVKFVKPVKKGDRLIAEATIVSNKENKFNVEVQVWRDVEEAFYGEFICIVPEKHVLE